MEYANTFRKEASDLKSRIVASIEANLKRIGTAHTDEADEPLEFFSYSTTAELEICGINADGSLMLVHSPDPESEYTIRGYIEDDLIGIDDAISLLENLEEI